MATDLYFYEDLVLGSPEHQEFFAGKEEKRLDFMTAELINKYGPTARELIDKAVRKILKRREARAIEILEEILVEKYGPEARELVEQARSKILFEREPKNVMTLADFVTKEYGLEAIDVMMEGNRKMWVELSKQLIDKLEIKEKDCIGAMKILSFVHRDMGEVVEASPNRAVRLELRCPMLPLFGADWCIRVSKSSLTGMANAVNPNIVLHQEEFACKGGSSCRVVYEMKE
ncbi:hypothetical protein ACFL4C_04020 [Candidatus Omnitrophota bacterium]